MAEFPPNLDDGELYLPSDIFLNEIIPAKFNPRDNRHRHLSCMDELAHHFTALSLLQQTRPTALKAAHHQLERFKPPVGSVVAKPPQQQPGYFGVSGGVERGQSLHECGTGSFSAMSEPGFDVQLLKPTPTQLERYLHGRANRVLQRQQNRLLQQNQNRVLPYQRGGFGGLRKESGGTGVFHPRIINCSSGSGSGSGSDANKKKRQSVRERQELRVSQQRNSAERVSVSNRQDGYYHLPPEMRLPRDWTY